MTRLSLARPLAAAAAGFSRVALRPLTLPLLLATLAGCAPDVGAGGEGNAPENATSTAAAPPPSGTVVVAVSLRGGAPEPAVIVADKDVPHCGAELFDTALLAAGERLIDAVAWIELPSAESATEDRGAIGDTPEPRALTIGSRGCLLQPRVQTAPVGSTLELRNGDSITHNPHGWLDDRRTVFNVTLIEEGQTVRRTLRAPGRYRIDCDTHSWMRAFVHVFPHGMHGVSDETGRIELRDVPVGVHTVRIWHEVLGERSLNVEVQANATAQLALEFEPLDHRSPARTPPGMKPWIDRAPTPPSAALAD